MKGKVSISLKYKIKDRHGCVRYTNGPTFHQVKAANIQCFDIAAYNAAEAFGKEVAGKPNGKKASK